MIIKHSIIAFLLLALNAGAQTDTASFAYNKPLFDFDVNKPVFKLSEDQTRNKNHSFRFYALTGYREGVPPSIRIRNFNYRVDGISGLQHFTMFNLSPVSMLIRVEATRQHKIILEVKDPSKYDYDPQFGSKVEWMRKNAYCYELTLPIGADLDNISREHIASLFGVKCGFEKRLEKTLVLVRTSDEEKFKAKGVGGFVDDSKNGIYKNNNFGALRYSLQQFSGLPYWIYFKNETGFDENSAYKIDMELNVTDWKDLQQVRKALQRYDLDLKEEMLKQDVFVIKELK